MSKKRERMCNKLNVKCDSCHPFCFFFIFWSRMWAEHSDSMAVCSDLMCALWSKGMKPPHGPLATFHGKVEAECSK